MWWSILPQIIGAAILLIAPGLLVALAVRFRGFDAVALAPALTVGIVVVTSTLTPFVNIRFGLVPVAVVSLLVAAAGMFAVRYRATRQPAAPRQRMRPLSGPWTLGGLVPFAAFGVAALLVAASVVRAIGSPQAFSQTYDAVFHLNSVKFALETGQASSLTIGGMTGGGFYPAGWNAVAVLVASTTGAEVPVAVNITSIVIAAVFWPLGCLLLTRWIVGPRASATVAAAIACASLGAFPLLMMDFGVLYPNLLAISLLPAAIALAASLVGLAPGSGRRDLATALTLLLGLAGLVVAHPTTFMAWVTWTLPMAGFLAWRSFGASWRNRRTGRGRFTKYVLSVSGYSIAFVALWIVLRPPADASFWGPRGTVPQAFGEALVTSPVDLSPAWLVAPLALFGLWSCFKVPKRLAWLGLVFVLFAGLYIVAAGFPKSPTRDFLTGVWYNDSFRVAALLPVIAVVLVAVGIDWVAGALPAARKRYRYVDRAVEGPARWSAPARLACRTAGGMVVVLTAIVLGQQGGLKEEVQLTSSHYRLEADSLLVSPDELAVLKRLPHSVPEDAVLIDNPYTGAALSYALGDRKSAQLHILSYVSPELQKIYDALGQVSTDPSVCRAVREEHGFYILDFGSKEVHGENHTAAGLTRLDQNPGLQLIDSQGEAKLYKITACGS
ncbi:DUF6541 family protein [Pseudarthrobacter sp. S9]|uniref:DUF6541 family protein n=1 Tax=Pseudarthrobacter sp. S9 TaxID=3418421 RepID=UPI003CFCCD02